MVRWEYRHIIGTTLDFEAELNLLGKDGWDLVFVTMVPGSSPVELLGILKREGLSSTANEVTLDQL